MSNKVNVQVTRNSNENSLSLIRRFSRQVQGTGILPRVKALRFYTRPKSKLKKKREALKRLQKQQERRRLIKLGKIQERPYHRNFKM